MVSLCFVNFKGSRNIARTDDGGIDMDRRKTANVPWVSPNQLPILQTVHDDFLEAKPQYSICSYAECIIGRVARRSHSRFSTPSALNLAKEAFVISFTVLHPVSCIHRRNSLCMVSSMSLTPASPSYYNATSARPYQKTIKESRGSVALTARPQIAGLPTQQHSAPSASALKISVPDLNPPSTCTLIRP